MQIDVTPLSVGVNKGYVITTRLRCWTDAQTPSNPEHIPFIDREFRVYVKRNIPGKTQAQLLNASFAQLYNRMLSYINNYTTEQTLLASAPLTSRIATLITTLEGAING